MVQHDKDIKSTEMNGMEVTDDMSYQLWSSYSGVVGRGARLEWLRMNEKGI